MLKSLCIKSSLRLRSQRVTRCYFFLHLEWFLKRLLLGDQHLSHWFKHYQPSVKGCCHSPATPGSSRLLHKLQHEVCVKPNHPYGTQPGWVPAPPISFAAPLPVNDSLMATHLQIASLCPWETFSWFPPHHSTHMGGFKRLRVRYSYALLMIGPYYLLSCSFSTQI